MGACGRDQVGCLRLGRARVFGQRLRALRTRAGMSQEDLALLAGVGVRTIGNLEAGRTAPRPSTRRVLADALGLDGADRSEFCSLAPADAPQEQFGRAADIIVPAQ